MKYFVLLASNGDMPAWDELTPDQQQNDMKMHGAFAAACAAEDGVEMVGGEALGDGTSATTLRTRGGKMTVTDGPFAEIAEHLGGFYILDAPDLDIVIELCKILPAYDIDIRPVLDMG
ncbi:MAG: YciI family protein [Ilumatobacteraceae bacterium]